MIHKRRYSGRVSGGLTVVALTAALLATGCDVIPTDTRSEPPQPNTVAPPVPERHPAGQPGTQGSLGRSEPTEFSIPAIDTDSSLVPLGLNPDQTIAVPPVTDPMQAGWYKLGATPGERGPAVILGHVDGTSGPGIFSRLPELKPGNEVRVARQDHTRLRFVVTRVEQVPKSAFPAERVYGDTLFPELRLITCGGSFDHTTRSYQDSLIVYAVLAR
jgi:hypothetical protein